MNLTIDIHDDAVDAFKRATFSEKDYEAAPIEILKFANEKENDKFAPFWFSGIGLAQVIDNRYFLTTLGKELYEQTKK